MGNSTKNYITYIFICMHKYHILITKQNNPKHTNAMLSIFTDTRQYIITTINAEIRTCLARH